MCTGQATAHMPSAAQVSTTSYVMSARIAAAQAASPRASAAASSRRETIRCRGVTVSDRDGHTGSQKPHSTHRSTSVSTGSAVLRSRR